MGKHRINKSKLFSCPQVIAYRFRGSDKQLYSVASRGVLTFIITHARRK